MGFAASDVATGWAEFLKRLRRLASAGERDHAAGWTMFKRLARASPQQGTLDILVHVGQDLPERERYRLAVGVTRLLAPIEWPEEWEGVRPGLADALLRLSMQMDPDAEDSFFARIATKTGAEARRMAQLAMVSAEDLLRKPRRDQLRTVALLCNAGMAVCIETHRRFSKTSDTREFQAFGMAIAGYTEAAGRLNEATGAVLFEGLYAALEED